MAEFAVVIQYTFPKEEPGAVVLSAVSDVRLSANATVTGQPVVSGDEVADHIFRSPKTMSVSGSCSLNGNDGIAIEGGTAKLANFQTLFERIQRQGAKCNVFKVSLQNDKDIRFAIRKNMVLNSISWTEKINTLDFSLSFTEVMTVDIASEPAVATDDEFLPDVTEPKTMSFTNALIDWTSVDAAINEILKKEGLLTTAFMNFLTALTKPVLASLVTASASMAIVTVMAALNTTPVGWVVTAFGLAIASAGLFIYGIVKAIQAAAQRRKYAIRKFDAYKNKKKSNKEVQRYFDFIADIHKQLESLNNVISVYQVAENTPQECLLTLDDDFFCFIFTRNNTTNTYSLEIQNNESDKLKVLSDVSAAPHDFGELTSGNFLIKTDDNARVYLLCPVPDNLSAEEERVWKQDISHYFILVCEIYPEDINEAIENIIKNNIYKNAAGK